MSELMHRSSLHEELPPTQDKRTEEQPTEAPRRAAAAVSEATDTRAPAEGGSTPSDGPNWGAVALGTALLGPLGGAAAYYATSGSSAGAAPAPAPATPAATVQLAGPALVTLGDQMALTATLSSGAVASGFTFEIKRTSEANWLQLGTGAAATLRATARAPGNMHVRVKAAVNGADVTSNTAGVTVQFMDLATVKTNGTCVGWFNTAWSETKAATSDGSRREQGFWIKYDSTTGSYVKTNETVGTPVNNTTGAVLNGFPSIPADPRVAANAGGAFAVAWYHTHTPTLYRVGGRGTGPSGGDYSCSSSWQAPGLAHDYSISPSAPQGHPLDSPVHTAVAPAHARMRSRRLVQATLASALLVAGVTAHAAPDAPVGDVAPPRVRPPKKAKKTMITRDKAIEIAKAYIKDKVTISPDSTLEVAEKPAEFIVEWRRHLTVPGPDFDAKVTVDKATGKVTHFLVDG